MRYGFLALLMMTASGGTQSYGLEIADEFGYWRHAGYIPCSGAPRLSVDTTLDSVIIEAVRALSLRDAFDHCPSQIDRAVLALGVGYRLRRVAFQPPITVRHNRLQPACGSTPRV